MIEFDRSFIHEARPPAFKPGDIIHHRKYGYRGVIVERDAKCLASKEWYRSNQSQPNRDQPWYHVLVHGGPQTTYVAEENIEFDSTGQPVMHPMIEVFFRGYLDGAYVRNDRPWPR